MSHFEVTLFFDGEGISRHYDREVLNDAQLRRSLQLDRGPSGGAILATANGSLMIEDDYDNIVEGLLTEVPNALRMGQMKIEFEFHYGPENLLITQSSGSVIIDNLNGTRVSAHLFRMF